jgi:hypothetical protein
MRKGAALASACRGRCGCRLDRRREAGDAALFRQNADIPMLRPAALLASAALALSALPAAAQSVWSAETYDYGSVLNLGIADSPEEVTLSLYCDNDEQYLELGIFQELADSEPGQPLSLAIATATRQVVIAGETSTDEMSGFVYASAVGFHLAPLLAVLKSPGPATVTMGPAEVVLPEEGRTEAVRTFAIGCRIP